MALGKRVIRFSIQMDSNDPNSIVTIDDTLDIDIQIHKDVLAYQNSAVVEVIGLSTSLRQTLLTRYTEYQLSRINDGTFTQDIFSSVTIDAGYLSMQDYRKWLSGGSTQLSSVSTIFKGELAYVEPSSPPPNIGVRFYCFTQQIDKTRYSKSTLPGSCTFKDVIDWAVAQFNSVSPVRQVTAVVNTTRANYIVTNPGITNVDIGGITAYLMGFYWPNVNVYFDDDILYVRDRGAPDNSVPPLQLTNFIGTPMWSRAGVKGTVMFNESMKLWTPVDIISEMNPSLGPQTAAQSSSSPSNGSVSNIVPPNFYVGTMDYHLTSRKTPFYVSFEAYVSNPQAGAQTPAALQRALEGQGN